MKKFCMLAAAALGLVAVILAAVVQHNYNLTESDAQSVETALLYNLVHAVLMVELAKRHKYICMVFCAGTVLFSGAIYGSVLLGFSYVAPLAPAGGGLLIIGWFMLFITALRNRI